MSPLQVKAAAVEAGKATFALVGNRDIDHLVMDLLHCVAQPEEVSDMVTKLSATTFVQVSCGYVVFVCIRYIMHRIEEAARIYRMRSRADLQGHYFLPRKSQQQLSPK